MLFLLRKSSTVLRTSHNSNRQGERCRMPTKNSEPQSFLDQVMEICDRILSRKTDEGDLSRPREEAPAAPFDHPSR